MKSNWNSNTNATVLNSTAIRGEFYANIQDKKCVDPIDFFLLWVKEA